jgi:hyperosmotically inducible periplasmic protein
MRTTYLSLLAAGAIACVGCEGTALDPTADTEAPPIVDPGPVPADTTPPATGPTTGDLGTQPGYAPGARAGDPNLATPGAAHDPTNTGLNERDTGDARPPLPTDQDATGPGFDVTTEIRQRITSTEGMSINARNVKIVTEGTTVTLRGPVQDDTEKQSIDRIAQDVAGDRYTVVNMLEVQDSVR